MRWPDLGCKKVLLLRDAGNSAFKNVWAWSVGYEQLARQKM
jgi:hypothetical protein